MMKKVLIIVVKDNPPGSGIDHIDDDVIVKVDFTVSLHFITDEG